MATGQQENVEARETLILGTPIRQAAPGALQFGSPWRTGPSTPLSAQLWRSIEPEQTPDQPIVNGYSCGGSLPRMHITVPERLPPDRTVRFDHDGTTYSVIIPPDYSPGSRVEVELTAANPAPMNLAAHHGLESPAAQNDTMSVLRIRRDVHRFRQDLRSYNGVKAHLRHQLELLEEESKLIDACLTSKAEIKMLSEELQASEEHVRNKKEKALATSPSKSTPSSRPEAERPAGDQDIMRDMSALGSASTSSELEAAKILADEEEKTEAAMETSEVEVILCDKPEDTVESIPFVGKSEAIVQRDSISPPKTRELPRTTAPQGVPPHGTQSSSSAPSQPLSSPQMRPSQPAVILPGPTRTTPRVVTRDLLSTAPIRPPLTMPAPVPSATSLMPPPLIGPPGGMPRPLGTGGGASASFSQPTNQTTAVRRESKQAWEIQQERRQPGVAMPPPRTIPMMRSEVAPSNAMMRQSSEAPPVPAPSKTMQVKSPRLTTRPDCLGPVCPVPGPRNDASQGVHPARSTLHICRPSGSVAVKPTGSATEGNRVRTSSPGFRRDQSYRTTLPANLPNSTNSTSISPRGSVVNTNKPGVNSRAVQWNVDGRTSRIR